LVSATRLRLPQRFWIDKDRKLRRARRDWTTPEWSRITRLHDADLIGRFSAWAGAKYGRRWI
jgi:hypothetical protein